MTGGPLPGIEDDTLDELEQEEIEALKLRFPGLPWPEPALAQLAEVDLWAFACQAWPHFENTPLIPGWHLREKCTHLEKVSEGLIDRLIINEPPRHMKPVWEEEPITMGDGSRRALREVEVGDLVLTHRMQPRTVDAVHVQGELPCLRLRTRSGRSLVLAPDHLVRLHSGDWVAAGKLDRGNMLALTVERNVYGPIPRPDELVGIEEAGTFPCRCLSVRQDRSFVAQDLAVHNSTITSVLFPSWEWTRQPDMTYLSMAWSRDLPERDNQRSRQLMSSEWYQARWGRRWAFTSDQNVKKYYKNNMGGYRLAVSMAGAIGSGGRRIIVDDPHNADELSRDALAKVVQTWNTSLALRNQPGIKTARILIMQMLMEGDLADHVLSNEKNMGWVHLCHDDQTEILTENGWKLFRDVQPGEQVAQVDTHDLTLSYVEPTARQDLPYSGPMLEWSSDSMSMVVTPDHRVVFKDGNHVRKEGLRTNWRVRSAATLPRTFYVPQAGYTNAPDVEETTLIGKPVKMDDWLEFMAYFLAEGCVRLRKDRPSGSGLKDVTLTQNEGPTCMAMRDVLRRLGLTWTECHMPRPKGIVKVNLQIANQALCKELVVYGKAADKFVPPIVKRLSARQIRLFLKFYQDGDGWVTGKGGVGICSISNRMVDDLQTLFVSIGWTCGRGPTKVQQRVSRGKHYDRAKFWGQLKSRHLKEKNYEGRVYCVSVPTGAVMCRRNGKPFVSGNCFPMLFEKDHPYGPCRTPWGGDRRTEVDEPLWPESVADGTVEGAKAELMRIRESSDAYVWATQAQQRTAPPGGSVFLKEWFTDNLYDELPEGRPFVFIHWDTSVKGEQAKHDPMNGYVMAHFPDLHAYYVLEEVRFWSEYPDQEEAVILTAEAYPEAQASVLEGKANGPAIVASIKRRMLLARQGSPDSRRLLAVRGIDTWDPGSTDPILRARAITPRMRAGDVKWPRWAMGEGGWLMHGAPGERGGAIHEFVTFPRGAHDDRVHTLVNAITWREAMLASGKANVGGRILLGRATYSHLLRLGGLGGMQMLTGRSAGEDLSLVMP